MELLVYYESFQCSLIVATTYHCDPVLDVCLLKPPAECSYHNKHYSLIVGICQLSEYATEKVVS